MSFSGVSENVCLHMGSLKVVKWVLSLLDCTSNIWLKIKLGVILSACI